MWLLDSLAGVIAGVAPINLLTLGQQGICQTKVDLGKYQVEETAKKKKILERQQRWEEEPGTNWTSKLILSLAEWMTPKIVEVNLPHSVHHGAQVLP